MKKKEVNARQAQRGIALFIVLAVLVLISVLVVAFFSSISTEVNSARTYANGATVKQLADSAVQLVVAQIADGTRGKNVNSDMVAWASQPGMIRTYNTSGAPDTFYKLYSASLPLAINGASVAPFNVAADTPPLGWNDPANTVVYQQYRGIYVDINSPVTHDGNTSFPIIDGNGMQSMVVSGTTVLTYSGTSVGGPSTSGTVPAIEGFSVDPAKVSYNSAQALSGTNNPVPMPVKWLYVLQDGKIANPQSSTNGAVSFDSSYPLPSAANPIVGRIAFWTDDETCKVNVNTASEGTFWDRPFANNFTEQNYAYAIPGQNEFQRYPGHPAKTCLSTIFGALLPSPTLSPSWYSSISSSQSGTNQAELKAYYDLAPRVADGATKGGTIGESLVSGTTSSANPAFVPITPDTDRLYATLDEFLYGPTLSGSLRTPSNVAINNGMLEKSRFFATAHSQAPELNLFGKPRMTLWPLQSGSSERNAKDNLIAFCSTIGGQPYYFQRYNSYSANPGNASSQSATMDWLQVARNQTLYTYLDNLMTQNVPGFGGNFKNKYSNYEQILTEMFDQIRSGVNAYSNSLTPQYSYAPTYLNTGEGQVVPLIPSGGVGNGTHGFGRFPTVTGAALVFFRSNTGYYTTSTNGVSTSGSTQNAPVVVDPAYVDPLVNPNGVVLAPATQIGAALVLNPCTVSPGFPPWSPNVQYVVSGLENLTINSNNANLGFATPPLNNTVTSRAEYSGLWNCSPFFGLVANFRYASGATDTTKVAGTTNPVTQYPFVTSGVQVGVTDKTFNFNGGLVTVKIYAGADTGLANPIQTIQMSFPPVNGLRVPTGIPVWAPNNHVPATSAAVTLFGQGNSLINDVGGSAALQKGWHDQLVYYSPIPTPTPTNPYIRAAAALGSGTDIHGNAVKYQVENIARGVEADPTATAAGDYRIYAALSSVPPSYFRACQGYDTLNGSVSGTQSYSNVQTLRDQGTDANGGGGFGYDAGEPAGYYWHDPTNSARNQVTFETPPSSSTAPQPGVLIPQNQLAVFGGGNGGAAGTHEYRSKTGNPAVPFGLQGAYMNNGNYGDWDNATGQIEDGPYINKPDEGNSSTVSNTKNVSNLDTYFGSGNYDISGGYFSFGFGATDYQAESGQTFSPNRQIASAVMFGSLPAGIDPNNGVQKPWQTLLFCPNPLANSSSSGVQGASHPGFGTSTSGSGDSGPPYSTLPDHLLLDLFTMPTVEPYAISEPFATAGKINMNYQIAPFTYIRRDTGVRAVLKSTRIMAIPQSVSTYTSSGASYKDGTHCPFEFRYNINPDENTGTLRGFENRFNNSDIFRSASEICSIFLVPQKMPNLNSATSYPAGSTPPASYAGTASWWDNFLLTGDNNREMPYGDIYARLTTKSNTFTVHMRVQTLKKAPGTSASQWVEGRDQVTGEYRGSQMVERYIDTGDPNLPNPANDFALSSAPSAETYYRIRLLNSTTFTP